MPLGGGPRTPTSPQQPRAPRWGLPRGIGLALHLPCGARGVGVESSVDGAALSQQPEWGVRQSGVLARRHRGLPMADRELRGPERLDFVGNRRQGESSLLRGQGQGTLRLAGPCMVTFQKPRSQKRGPGTSQPRLESAHGEEQEGLRSSQPRICLSPKRDLRP